MQKNKRLLLIAAASATFLVGSGLTISAAVHDPSSITEHGSDTYRFNGDFVTRDQLINLLSNSTFKIDTGWKNDEQNNNNIKEGKFGGISNPIGPNKRRGFDGVPTLSIDGRYIIFDDERSTSYTNNKRKHITTWNETKVYDLIPKGGYLDTELGKKADKTYIDQQVTNVTNKINSMTSGKAYTAGSDINISSANAISVKKAGLIASGNTGLVTGGTVYSTTNALNTQITATSQAVESLSDKISTYGKTISSISTSVTNTLSSMKNTQANFVDTSLSNISSDGRDVIKQVVKDVLAANTASTTSSTAFAKAANLLKASFVSAPMRAAANLTAGDHVNISGNTISIKADGTVASGDTGLVTGGAVYEAVKDKANKSYVDEGLARKADISYVDQGLSQKVNVSDFTPVKQQVETNTSDISALKTGKADADGSNINVGSFAAKLNTGKVEKGNTGLVSGGTVYDSLQTKADVGYVDTMGLALDSEIKGTAQGLHNEIQDMENRLTKDINRVGAGSAALAALHPQDFNPDDKWDFAVGYGHYKNANASAVGTFYRPNAGTTVSLAATIGNGDPQVSAGVSFKIGMGKNVEKVVITKEKYDKLNKTVESQNERIEKLEAMVQKFMTSGK